ncbi:MAG: hypothetical protein ISS49_16470 [Anaerolineae bacterium]|nr:hypothetical protein [Anaerolineae bacterium]
MQRYAHHDDRSLALEIIPSWLDWVEQQDMAGAYMATWIAFNAIYVAEYKRPYAERAKNGPKYPKEPNEYGLKLIRLQGPPSERCMIRHTLGKLPPYFKWELLNLSSPTKKGDTCLSFFARRIPVWQDTEIAQDELKQLVNGVINVRRTLNQDTPHWTPVDLNALEQFTVEAAEGATPNIPTVLVNQIGDLLYTVRNNLFHGCKVSGDSNDDEVLRNALELLRAIVTFYINWTD